MQLTAAPVTPPLGTGTDGQANCRVGAALLRLVGAGPGDVAAVEREVGRLAAEPTAGAPDVTVEFVHRLPLREPLLCVGTGVASVPEGLVVAVEGGRVLVPLADVGRGPVVLCERGVQQVPLLVDLLNAGVLARGVLPLHAAAVRHGGTGTMVTGWSHGGKTEAVLGLLELGAQVVADEWVHLAGRPPAAEGVRVPVRLWRWHLERLEDVRRGLPRRDRARLRVNAALLPGVRAIGWPGSLAAALEPVDGVWLPLEQLAGDRLLDRCTIERVVLVEVHESSRSEAVPVSGRQVAARMAHSLQAERWRLVQHYLAYRYACPERRSGFLEDELQPLEQAVLHDVLDPLPAVRVLHPPRGDFLTLARLVTGDAH